MPKQYTGESWQDSYYAKDLDLGQGKEGKTLWIVSSVLGLLPPQLEANSGGVVSKPEHLHIFAFDESTLDGTREFLRDILKAPPEALKYDAWNFEDEMRKVHATEEEHQATLYNALLSKMGELKSRIKPGEVHVFLYSSVSKLVTALKREISGRPTQGAGMDQYKWDAYNARCREIQMVAQEDVAHCIWEGHVMKSGGGGQNDAPAKESILIQGSQAQQWALNARSIFRIRRQKGVRWANTKCDKVYMDTKPALEGDYMINGRGHHALAEKEENLTEVYAKQKLRVGRWGRKSTPPAKTKVAAAS